MQNYRLIIYLLIFLSGCSSESYEKQLKSENEQLRTELYSLQSENKALLESNSDYKEQIRSDFVKRTAEIETKTRAAAVSSGCRHIINICPASITKPGDIAISEGISGGTDWVFWSIYFAKVMLLFSPLIVFLELWTSRFKPNLDALKIANAELEVTKFSQAKIQNAIGCLIQANKELELKNLELEEIVKAKKAEIEVAEASLKAKQSISAALNSFKL